MKKKIVYFTGSLPNKGKVPVGGGEVGNMRTLRMLQSFGYETKVVRRIRSNAVDSKVKRIITYPFRFLLNFLHFFFVLICGDRNNGIVHIAGFYGPTISIECAQVFLAKLLGYRLVYEMRGGGADNFYDNGSEYYRKQFRFCIKKADYIFSQGKENEALLNNLCRTPVFYYPNCVQKGFYPESMPSKPMNKIRLLFYGRIEEEKNPLLIVEVAALLQKVYNNITLTIIGNGQSEILTQVKTKMKNSLSNGSYELLPGCEHDKLQSHISDKHFYIFPSVQPREGQSNAITESMSFGIIPIASPQGFNRSTIGDDRLIVESLRAEDYANRIKEIIVKDEIEYYSQYVRKRFIEHYTEDAVFKRTKEEYLKIFNETKEI